MSTKPLSPRQVASATGQKTYNPGSPCKNGHTSDRYTNNYHCVACSSEHTKAWFASRPPGETKQRWKAWCVENREARNAYKRAHKWKPDPAKKRQWAIDNPDKAKASARKYYDNNREHFRAKVRNRDARKRAAQGSHTAVDIQDILVLQGSKCAYCRAKLAGKYQIDHIEPLIAGGSNDRANLQALCEPCNKRKGAINPLQYARQIGLLL